jgi:DNA-binding NarL/FixJ family response regulator
MVQIQVLLVDDSAEFLDSISRFLRLGTALQIVGVATSGADAIERAAELKPDLVLMDLAMPGMNGLEATVQLKAGAAPPCVVIMTLHDNAEYRDAARAAAADGFITKSAIRAQLFPMIASLFERPACE